MLVDLVVAEPVLKQWIEAKLVRRVLQPLAHVRGCLVCTHSAPGIQAVCRELGFEECDAGPRATAYRAREQSVIHHLLPGREFL